MAIMQSALAFGGVQLAPRSGFSMWHPLPLAAPQCGLRGGPQCARVAGAAIVRRRATPLRVLETKQAVENDGLPVSATASIAAPSFTSGGAAACAAVPCSLTDELHVEQDLGKSAGAAPVPSFFRDEKVPVTVPEPQQRLAMVVFMGLALVWAGTLALSPQLQLWEQGVSSSISGFLTVAIMQMMTMVSSGGGVPALIEHLHAAVEPALAAGFSKFLVSSTRAIWIGMLATFGISAVSVLGIVLSATLTGMTAAAVNVPLLALRKRCRLLRRAGTRRWCAIRNLYATTLREGVFSRSGVLHGFSEATAINTAGLVIMYTVFSHLKHLAFLRGTGWGAAMGGALAGIAYAATVDLTKKVILSPSGGFRAHPIRWARNALGAAVRGAPGGAARWVRGGWRGDVPKVRRKVKAWVKTGASTALALAIKKGALKAVARK